MPEKCRMKCVRRESVVKDFEITYTTPVPAVPYGGARVKVSAGTFYRGTRVKK